MNTASYEQLLELSNYLKDQIPKYGIGGGYAPIGTIIQYMGVTAPQDYLICDGTVYNIADYPQLADFFESQFGSSNFFGGDGAATFAVPDLRGEFLRGSGANSHTDQGSGGEVGEHQDGTAFPYTDVVNNNSLRVFHETDYAGPSLMDATLNASTISLSSASMSSTALTNKTKTYTSRPTNTSVLYCIKAVVAGEVYSTEERVVGTWIDGKPLYQYTEVISIPNIPKDTRTWVYGNKVFTDLDTVVGFHGSIKTVNDSFSDIGGARTSTDQLLVQISRSNGLIGIVIQSDWGDNYYTTAYVTVQYTKTTDTAS